MTSSSEGEILQTGQLIRDRWKISKKVGGGGFGEIFEALDLQNHNERVAIKVESSKATKQVLKMEVAVLRRLQGKKHACKFYGCGRNDKFNYLVMSLQGKNLADLRRESPRQCFSVSTAIRLGVQILQAIREIHSIGFLHRDVKPSNFSMGRSQSTMRMVFMLDFGLARQYLNTRGEIRSPRSAAGFRGTVRYAAVTAHKNKEMGRQDDLFSLFYMLVEFLQGALPWRKIKDKDEVGRMKEEANFETLLDGCPPELLQLPTHLKTLGYFDDPDYDFLEDILKSVLGRLEISMDEPYDWEMNYENISNRSKTTTTNGNVSTRLKSHTTAVKDRGPEDKNRALDTQAPITMGEDDDEQTGNGFRYLPPNSNHADAADKPDKPKYKRQEFMRPKYGAVSFDVIETVNARLAAAANAAAGSSNDNSNNGFFNRVRYDTAIENDKSTGAIGNGTNGENINVELNVRPAQLDAGNHRGAYTAPGTPLAYRRPQLHTPTSAEVNKTNSKNNRSITLSAKQSNGQQRYSPGEAPSAIGGGEGNSGGSYMKMTPSPRWPDSYEETADDIIPIDAVLGPKSPMNNRFPRNLHSPLQHQPDTSGVTSPHSSSNNNGAAVGASSINAGGAHSYQVSTGGGSSPKPTKRPLQGSKSSAPLASTDSGLGGSPVGNGSHTSASSTIMSHFKNLVNSFNNLGGNSNSSRRRSLSRVISFDDNRSSNKPSTASTSLYRKDKTLDDLQASKLSYEDEERELRRQRRHQRRSGSQQPLSRQISDDRLSSSGYIMGDTTNQLYNSGYRVESKLRNNGVLVDATSHLDDAKPVTSCRRKRYQFLNFAPRAMSRS